MVYFSVVVVGGDGLYHETLNGLQRRLIKEAGLDENDSNSDLQPMPIPIGLIPAGMVGIMIHLIDFLPFLQGR